MPTLPSMIARQRGWSGRPRVILRLVNIEHFLLNHRIKCHGVTLSKSWPNSVQILRLRLKMTIINQQHLASIWRSSRSGKYFLIPSADRLIIFAYIENVRCSHILALEKLALRRFDFAVGRHAVGGDDNLLAFFGQE